MNLNRVSIESKSATPTLIQYNVLINIEISIKT